MQVVHLTNGPNSIDLDGDGVADQVFMAWRENYNAHGYNRITFYVSYANADAQNRQWNLLPFFEDREGHKDSVFDSFATYQGADCVISDLRVLRRAGSGPVTVIIGTREMGKSFADSAAVTFDVYEVAHNDDGEPGRPPLYLDARKTIKGRKPYCDIDDAFKKEIGIGPGRSESE